MIRKTCTASINCLLHIPCTASLTRPSNTVKWPWKSCAGKGYETSSLQIAFYTVAHGYYALGKLENAERVCLEALDYFPMHLDMCHILASVYFKRQSLDLCRTTSQRLSFHL